MKQRLPYIAILAAALAERLLNDQRLLNIPLVRIDNGSAADRNEAARRSLVQPTRLNSGGAP